MLINILYGEYDSVIALMQDHKLYDHITQVMFYPVTGLTVSEFGLCIYKNPLLFFLN